MPSQISSNPQHDQKPGHKDRNTELNDKTKRDGKMPSKSLSSSRTVSTKDFKHQSSTSSTSSSTRTSSKIPKDIYSSQKTQKESVNGLKRPKLSGPKSSEDRSASSSKSLSQSSSEKNYRNRDVKVGKREDYSSKPFDARSKPSKSTANSNKPTLNKSSTKVIKPPENEKLSHKSEKSSEKSYKRANNIKEDKKKDGSKIEKKKDNNKEKEMEAKMQNSPQYNLNLLSHGTYIVGDSNPTTMQNAMIGSDENKAVDPSHNSLETLESGISVTSPNELSDVEVEESISSRLVEVDEMEVNDLPSLPSSSFTPQNGSQNANSFDYEDDFEDYESDFEDEGDDVSETDEESDHSDSDYSEDDGEKGSPDRQMVEVLKALKAENEKSNGISDGYENYGVGNYGNQITKQERPKTTRAFVNFERAKERALLVKASQKIKTRGQKLQEMIELDTISIELFTQMPDSYEAYISAFGKANTSQVGIQTNEDNLSVEVQTESPQTSNKWTQKPVNVSVATGDYLGVGGDGSIRDESDIYKEYLAMASDSNRLTQFLDAASQVMLQILEEEAVLSEGTIQIEPDKGFSGFHKSLIELGSSLGNFLEGRPCTLVSFCPLESLLVTGHGYKLSKSSEDSIPTSSSSDAFLCLWSVHQPSFPKMILTCHSPPLVSCFSPHKPYIIIGGLTDGSLGAWDLRERTHDHNAVINIGKITWRLRPPSFLTACSPEEVLEGSEIVALQTLTFEDFLQEGAFQVVSLSSSGQLTWWVLLEEEYHSQDGSEPEVSHHIGAAPWSKILLSRTASISLSNTINRDDAFSGIALCYDMKVCKNDPHLLYIATSTGHVVCYSRHNVKVHPSQFSPAIEPGGAAVSIAMCPHDPHYFLVGCSDGLIRLHSTTSSLPLTCWQTSNNPSPVMKLEWSPSRPCVFYVLDVFGDFHIWDLNAGDINPTISVSTKNNSGSGLIEGQLIGFDFEYEHYDDSRPVFAGFVSDGGSVGLRTIAEDFVRKNEEEYNVELHRFKCYVNII